MDCLEFHANVMNFPPLPNIAPWEAVVGSAALLAFSCLVVAIVSVIGGWYRLSKLYPAEETTYRMADETTSKKYRWASLVMGPPYFPTNYGNCLNVVVSDQGVRIAVGLLFRTLHPPIFIPWSAVESCTLDRQFAIFTRATVEIDGIAHPLRLFGNCAREIDRLWKERATLPQYATREFDVER